jgi:hypothetical protein
VVLAYPRREGVVAGDAAAFQEAMTACGEAGDRAR